LLNRTTVTTWVVSQFAVIIYFITYNILLPFVSPVTKVGSVVEDCTCDQNCGFTVCRSALTFRGLMDHSPIECHLVFLVLVVVYRYNKCKKNLTV